MFFLTNSQQQSIADEVFAPPVPDPARTLETAILDAALSLDDPLPLDTLPSPLPQWAMPLADHESTFQRTAVYRCTDPLCNGEHDEYRQNPRDLPYAKRCGCLRFTADAAEASVCQAAAVRRTTYPGEGVPLNARRFEPLVVYERANYESASDDFKRGHDKYYIPGRNNEPTEPGMIRHEITNIQDYNRFSKSVNAYETQKGRDHRSMHEFYWSQRRKALRDHVDARIRHNPLLMSLARLIRKRSDQKSAARYGKGMDAHFHSQLIEFNQGSIQDWCAEDTGWKSRRAR
jgi:hypothetical protein